MKKKVNQQLVVATSEQNHTHSIDVLRVILVSKQLLNIEGKHQDVGLCAASWFRKKINGVGKKTNGDIGC